MCARRGGRALHAERIADASHSPRCARPASWRSAPRRNARERALVRRRPSTASARADLRVARESARRRRGIATWTKARVRRLYAAVLGVFDTAPRDPGINTSRFRLDRACAPALLVAFWRRLRVLRPRGMKRPSLGIAMMCSSWFRLFVRDAVSSPRRRLRSLRDGSAACAAPLVAALRRADRACDHRRYGASRGVAARALVVRCRTSFHARCARCRKASLRGPQNPLRCSSALVEAKGVRTLRAARACPDFGSSRRTAGSRLLASLATEREALGERLVVRGACSPEKLIWRWRAISSVLSRREGFRSVSRRWRGTAGDCDAGWCSAKSCATASMADRAGGGRACTRSSAGRGRNDDRCAARWAQQTGVNAGFGGRGGAAAGRLWTEIATTGDCATIRECVARPHSSVPGRGSLITDGACESYAPAFRRGADNRSGSTNRRSCALSPDKCVARMNARAHRDRRAWPDPRAPVSSACQRGGIAGRYEPASPSRPTTSGEAADCRSKPPRLNAIASYAPSALLPVWLGIVSARSRSANNASRTRHGRRRRCAVGVSGCDPSSSSHDPRRSPRFAMSRKIAFGERFDQTSKPFRAPAFQRRARRRRGSDRVGLQRDLPRSAGCSPCREQESPTHAAARCPKSMHGIYVWLPFATRPSETT